MKDKPKAFMSVTGVYMQHGPFTGQKALDPALDLVELTALTQAQATIQSLTEENQALRAELEKIKKAVPFDDGDL